MKKICISNFDDIKNPSYGGGGAVAVQEISKRLTKYFKITVFTGKYERSKDEYIDGILYRRVGINTGNPRLNQLFFHWFLPYYVMTEKFDLWIESFTPPVSTSFLPLFTKKPVVGVTHFLNAEEKSKQYHLPFYAIQNIGLKFYKHFIVMTSEIKSKIESLTGSANIAVIPNGVSVSDVKLINPSKHILFIGRIEVFQKGIGLLLKAFKLISKHTKLKLVLAGDGSEDNVVALNKQIKSLNIGNRVEWLGQVTGKNKAKLFNEAMCVVIPSRFENQSIVSLESLSYGKPIVCFDISGFSWLKGMFVFKAKPFIAEELAKTLLLVEKEMKKNNKEIRKASLTYSKNFTWQKTSTSYIKFIQNVLKNK